MKVPVETIRERVDIVELVREYVPGLRKAGRNHKACCPFHQEKTPSFTVSQEKQMFYCFGCSEGGDAFKFVMKIENVDFSEAAKRLAARAGVEWSPRRESLGPKEKERMALVSALEFAKSFYRKVLLQSPRAEEARRYLSKRGIKAATSEVFELGYSLPYGTSFLESALTKGIHPHILVKAGLTLQLEGPGKYRDYFRGRLMFPIRNHRGDIVGFGGRELGNFEPKYLNSPETPLFSKGKVLYGLYQGSSSVRGSKVAVILEGYMDVLTAYQHGLKNAVAPLGTALTPDHALILRRYAGEVILVFDPDEAGKKASVRSAELLLENGVQVSIATLPEGLDPDDFLKKYGLERLKECLAGAVDIAGFETDLALGGYSGGMTSLEKSRVASDLLATVARQPNPVLRREWVKRLSQRLGLDEESLVEELKRTQGVKKSGGGTKTSFQTSKERDKPARVSDDVLAVEKEVVRMAFVCPDIFGKEPGAGESDFGDERCRRVWRLWRECAGPGVSDSGAFHRFLERLSPEDSAWVSRLVMEDLPKSNWADLQARLRYYTLKRRETEIVVEMGRLEEQGLPTSEKLNELKVVVRKLRGRS